MKITAKGTQACHKSRLQRASIPRLVRNLAWDSACSDRLAVGSGAVESVPAADIDKRQLDEKPKADQCNQGSKRDRGR